MPLNRIWLRTLIGGAAIYGLVTVAAETTKNIHLLPVVLLLGALLLPVTFVVYLFERLPPVQPAILPTLAVCFGAGGSIGVAAAAILEYQTLRDLGTMPMLAVGVIEESVKLAVPLWLLLGGRCGPARALGLDRQCARTRGDRDGQRGAPGGADPPGPPRATPDSAAGGRVSRCCSSWWRDFTPSLRNALRR